MTAPVVVGIDDIDHSRPAVAAAVREARLRAAPLWLAHAYAWLAPVRDSDVTVRAVRDAATDLLARALTEVSTEFPDLDVHTFAMSGPAARDLAALARDAALLVVGHRGRGGFAGLLLGSVAYGAVSHARCPVMVVHGGGHPRSREVVVGMDLAAGDGDSAALAFAFEEAALRRESVRALHVVDDPLRLVPAGASRFTREQLAAGIAVRTSRLAEEVGRCHVEFPQVTVTHDVVPGVPSETLLAATERADLLVIGGRRHRDGTGMRVGGLAHGMLRHARCPVVVVPGPGTG